MSLKKSPILNTSLKTLDEIYNHYKFNPVGHKLDKKKITYTFPAKKKSFARLFKNSL